VIEATYDPAKKTVTAWFEGPDMTGKVTKTRSVTECKRHEHTGVLDVRARSRRQGSVGDEDYLQEAIKGTATVLRFL